MNPSELMAALLGSVRERPAGPVAWCKTCHRKHPRREHPATFRQVQRTLPSGEKRMHWAHCAVPEKPKKRTRARRS